ncbi:hypothetical protein ACQEVC_25210 [Plantactinospora sp. CA-294935]|uniref:hypothetical protein n=1 Tax=Plantactinospora sp. CA-294935 TaxID=3240012 RepID=UPI003D89B0D5
MKILPWFGTAALVAGAVVLVSGSSLAATEDAADTPPSLVEDYTHPGADQILAQHNLKVFKGDGHIMFVTSRTFDEQQCASNEIQVEKWLAVEPYGIYYCFRTTGTQGYLTLEVPGTFGIRGGERAIQAKAELPDGEKTYQVSPGGFVAIDPGGPDEQPQAVLVELRMAGS